jgi:hypothetical protein
MLLQSIDAHVELVKYIVVFFIGFCVMLAVAYCSIVGA